MDGASLRRDPIQRDRKESGEAEGNWKNGKVTEVRMPLGRAGFSRREHVHGMTGAGPGGKAWGRSFPERPVSRGRGDCCASAEFPA